MPNRIIKESLCTSEKIAELTDFEFRLWVGLITQADDMGRGDARAAIIKGRVFPLRDRITAKDIDAAVHGLAAKGCVSLYTVGGKPYFWFPTWSEHQRVRDCKPKFPGPEESDENQQDLFFCGNSPQSAAGCGEMRPESNPNPNTNPNPNIPPCIPPQGEMPQPEKKPAKKATADPLKDVVDDWTMDGELRDLLYEWLKVRKAKRAANTEGAIRQNLKKLPELAQQSGMSMAEYLEEVVRRGWQAFYKISDNSSIRGTNNGTTSRMNDVFAQVQRRNSGEY